MITFSNTKYERSHFKAPRGRGNWIFETSTGAWYTVHGSLTEAKAQVKELCRRDGYSGTVYVMP